MFTSNFCSGMFVFEKDIKNYTVAGQENRIRDKETESPYLVHPLTYS